MHSNYCQYQRPVIKVNYEEMAKESSHQNDESIRIKFPLQIVNEMRLHTTGSFYHPNEDEPDKLQKNKGQQLSNELRTTYN